MDLYSIILLIGTLAISKGKANWKRWNSILFVIMAQINQVRNTPMLPMPLTLHILTKYIHIFYIWSYIIFLEEIC